jgi:hypothetical protein
MTAMEDANDERLTAFSGSQLIATGSRRDVALAMKAAADAGAEPLIAFDDATGRQVEFDLRGSADDVLGRLQPTRSPAEVEPPKPGRGRPKLGVTAREVTLLPRHWDWLATQPGGASAALRRLVEQAKRSSADADRGSQAQEAAYRVMIVLAGDLPNFEEAARAFYAKDEQRFSVLIAIWPKDVSDYLCRLTQMDKN